MVVNIFLNGRKLSLPTFSLISNLQISFCSTSTTKDHGEFRVLELIKKKQEKTKTKKIHMPVSPPRYLQMPTDQDWSAVWPGPRTFHPAVVPFPLRQGYQEKDTNPIPHKFANAELMKIPNFLHLTPPVIKKHCEAIKKFCTKWPEGLETEEKQREHFPVEIISSDYCYSSPTIREPLARIVSLRVKLSSLHLDAHAKDKLLRLLGNRYNPETDFITITADRCPLKQQNLEYVEYLITAVYNEAWNIEPWESEKEEVDMEYYDWEKNASCKNLVTIYKWPFPPTDFDYENIPHVTEYKMAVTDLINNGEDEFSVNKYKEAVKNILHLKKPDDKTK
ncbi:small ribosomal subunit protein mS35 [Prorops nasuta]|uniref:small ribosomal subunit protein mS35 n=1 Tax=Prorops nasuta TaxID=863751 RepID=UPI0034CE5E38